MSPSSDSLEIIRVPLLEVCSSLRTITLSADRHTLAKRRWRGTAENGREFGFDLAEPLSHGVTFFQTSDARYVIAQTPEPVLAVHLHDPTQAARVAWQVGNLHFPVAIRAGTILVEDDLALRQMFEREHIHFKSVREVFQPLSGAAGHHHHSH